MKESSLTHAEVLGLFTDVKTVAICGHVNPDGDALGSCLALAYLLRQTGHTVTCLLAQDSPPPQLYAFLEDYEFVPASGYTDSPDLFIAVDSPALSRLGCAETAFKRAAVTLVIDHHPDYEGYGDYYHGSASSSATGLLVWDLIRESKIEVSRYCAECCYVALMTDTGRFAFQNTHTEAFRAAAEMIEAGVSPSYISSQVYQNKSIPTVVLESRLIERMKFSENGQVAYSWITEHDFDELGLNRDDTEGLPDILRAIKGVEIAVLLRVEGDSVRVNLRAKNECDVGSIARRMGGGGHAAAAGFTLECGIDEVLDKILPIMNGLDCINPNTASK